MRRRTTNSAETPASTAPAAAAEASVVPTQDAPAGTYIEDGDLYGMSAEFETPEQLVEAAHRAYAAGYRQMDAYTPVHIEGLPEALGFRDFYVPSIMLAAGILGALGGFFFLVYCTMISYPLNIGGRPLWSWPSWVPITFECTVLCTAFTGVFGMFNLNRLPEPYHPMFDAPGFERCSSSRFFLGIEAADAEFDREKTRAFLETLGAYRVADVPLRK